MDDKMRELMVSDNFVLTLNRINEELNRSGNLNIEYYILLISSKLNKDISIKSYAEFKEQTLRFVYNLLNEHSKTFQEQVFNDENVLVFFQRYCSVVFDYYNDTMNLEQSRFDSMVDNFSNSRTPSIKELKSDLAFTTDHIQNTMKLLNEALRVYYEVYDRRTLISTFSDEQQIQFKIKESELAHLLGISFEKILKDPKLVSALGISNSELEILNLSIQRKYRELELIDPTGSAVISVLHKFLDTKNGNLMQYEEDRVKKIINGSDYAQFNFNGDKNSALIQNYQVYSKMNMKSKAFLKFKPLENLSMLLSMPEGYGFIKQSTRTDSQYGVLVSNAGLSSTYKYATLLNNIDSENPNRRYFESLLIKKPEEIQSMKLVKGAKAAITKEVILESDDGTGRPPIVKLFTEEQQRKFISEVYRDFKEIDFSEVIEYFSNLSEQLNNSHGRK